MPCDTTGFCSEYHLQRQLLKLRGRSHSRLPVRPRTCRDSAEAASPSADMSNSGGKLGGQWAPERCRENGGPPAKRLRNPQTQPNRRGAEITHDGTHTKEHRINTPRSQRPRAWCRNSTKPNSTGHRTQRDTGCGAKHHAKQSFVNLWG